MPPWRGPRRWLPHASTRSACGYKSQELPGTGNIAVRLDYRSPVRFAPLGIVLDDLVLSGEGDHAERTLNGFAPNAPQPERAVPIL